MESPYDLGAQKSSPLVPENFNSMIFNRATFTVVREIAYLLVFTTCTLTAFTW